MTKPVEQGYTKQTEATALTILAEYYRVPVADLEPVFRAWVKEQGGEFRACFRRAMSNDRAWQGYLLKARGGNG